jgi:DNA-binding transcriptional LysR family regulator
MNDIHFSSLDLNLLRVFAALLDEGGVTPAAKRLGLTQSAISHALGRLRHALGDPLFVRIGAGMRPTPRALELGARIAPALRQLQAALEPAEFDPRQTRRRFTLAASGYVCTVLAPELLARLNREAPGASVVVRGMSDSPVEGLDTGRLDLAIGGFGRTPERFGKQALIEDDLVWVMDARQAVGPAGLTLERLAALPHLVVGVADDPQTGGETVMDHGLERRVLLNGGVAFQEALAARGLSRAVGLSLPDGHTAVALLPGTSLAALLPRRLAAYFAGPLNLRAFDPPHASPAIDIAMVWSKDQDSPAAAWFRGLVQAAAEAVAG